RPVVGAAPTVPIVSVPPEGVRCAGSPATSDCAICAPIAEFVTDEYILPSEHPCCPALARTVVFRSSEVLRSPEEVPTTGGSRMTHMPEPAAQVSLTGVKPTGEPHLGNLIGAIRPA